MQKLSRRFGDGVVFRSTADSNSLRVGRGVGQGVGGWVQSYVNEASVPRPRTSIVPRATPAEAARRGGEAPRHLPSMKRIFEGPKHLNLVSTTCG